MESVCAFSCAADVAALAILTVSVVAAGAGVTSCFVLGLVRRQRWFRGCACAGIT